VTYVHCGTCRCAFDATAHRRCPGCGARLGIGTGPGSVEDEVADAAAQLARALTRATPDQLDQLAARLGDRPAPAPGTGPVSRERWAEVVLGALGGAVAEERGLALACIPPPGELRPPAAPPAPDLRELAAALVVGVVAAVARPLGRAGRPAAARAAARTAGLARRVWSALA
jgi:hypothetical protein